jgi:hypothetical protein
MFYSFLTKKLLILKLIFIIERDRVMGNNSILHKDNKVETIYKYNESHILGNTLAILGTAFAFLLITFAVTFFFILNFFNPFWVTIFSFLGSYIISIIYYLKQRKNRVSNLI